MTASTSARVDAALRVLAATLGTAPLALFTAALVARFAPLSTDGRFALAYIGVIPLWIVLMCFAFLARHGARALAVCLGASLMLAALLSIAPH